MPPEVFRGDIGREERDKYGENTWYEWSWKNWGTKWDATDYKCDALDQSIEMVSAWAPPMPVIKVLSEKMPDSLIAIDYVDADWPESGNGSLKMCNGHVGKERQLNADEIAELQADACSLMCRQLMALLKGTATEADESHPQKSSDS